MMRRREFMTLLGGAAAAWPLAVGAQQPATPVVGFLRSSTAAGSEHIVAGLRRGLHETGYVDGQNVAIEYRWGDDHLERLPGLAADLVSRRVSVIVGSSRAGTMCCCASSTSATKAVAISCRLRAIVCAAQSLEAAFITAITSSGCAAA